MCSLCLATAVHQNSQLWLSLTGHTAIRFYVDDGSAVIQASGAFDNGAITPCRAALDAATNTPHPIVLDLRAVDPPVRVSVALIGAMRRYAKVRGATLSLTNVEPPWMNALAKAGVGHWYDATVREESAGRGT
jgi:anti-anti-sigma regulatory factor